MEKKTFFLIIVMFCSTAFSIVNAQFSYSTYSLGYMQGKKTIDKFSYTVAYTPSDKYEYSNFKPETFKLRWVPLYGEAMAPNYYIYLGGNFHFSNTDTVANIRSKEVDYFQIKFAGGVNIADKFSILIGAQAELRMLLLDKPKPDAVSAISSLPSFQYAAKTVDLYFDYQGGYHYGGNLTAYTTFSENFCFRSSFFLNKVAYKGIWGNDGYPPKFRGWSLEEELALYLFLPGREHRLGLEVQYVHRNLNLTCVDNDDNSEIYIPDNTSSANYLMVSILLGIVKESN